MTGSGSSDGPAGTGATAAEAPARLTRFRGCSIVPAMRRRHVLALLLLLITPLTAGVAASHAHDSLQPGLYSTQCPLQELAGHSLAVKLSAPAPAPLVVIAAAVPAFIDLALIAAPPLAAAPRAPPAR